MQKTLVHDARNPPAGAYKTWFCSDEINLFMDQSLSNLTRNTFSIKLNEFAKVSRIARIILQEKLIR